MANIKTRMTILFIVFFGWIHSELKAQMKDEPSKDDTFEYILHEVADFKYYTNDTWPLYNLAVSSFDKKNYVINLSYFNETLKCTYVESIHLDNIKSVQLHNDAVYGPKDQRYEHVKRVNMVTISFKSQSNEVAISCEDYKSENAKDKISIAIFDNERATKFERAVNHLIELFGNGFNPDLFN